jgi:hypothetical protein
VSRTKIDYPTLRQEYISTDVSIRALCEKHEVKSWSTVNERKNREDWDGLREAFRSRLGEREVQTLVQARLKTISDIHEELLLAIRHGVRRYVTDVSKEEGAQAVSARDLMGLIDKFLLLSGSTPHRTESRSVDTHNFTLDGILADAPPELLRQLADLAGERGSGGLPVGRGPLVVLEGTGS